jgi:small subunit ribosomal protein S2
MSEPMAPATAAPEPQGSAQVLQATRLTVRDLFEAGVHFGHQTRRWNPRMKPFLFGERNGVHIVDLDQTLPRLEAALEFVRRTIASGGKLLFVGTKRQAQAPIQSEAERAGQFYVNRRWLGGMLTNFKTVRKSIERFKEQLELLADEQRSAELSKKDLAGIQRSVDKYRKSLDGIKEMTRLPDAIFVIDVGCEAIAIKEANRLGIPIIGVVDSNCDPDSIDYVVPGNDDSLRAIQLYCYRLAEACIEGAQLFDERVQAEVAEEERTKVAGAPPERATSGKVVAEITQQPRRGRGTHSAGGPRKDSGTAPSDAPQTGE